MQHDYFQEKNALTFDPTYQGVEGLFKDRICATMLLHRDSVYVDINMAMF